MNYEGLVTSVNEEMCLFLLDDKIHVHVAHLFIYESNTLPQIGDKVLIRNAHYFSDPSLSHNLFICNRSTLKIIKPRNDSKSSSSNRNIQIKDVVCNLPFLNIVKKYKLGFVDLLKINQNIKYVSELVQSLSVNTSESIITAIIDVLPKNESKINDEYICYNNILPKFSLKTISHIERRRCNKYNRLYWSFGVHKKSKPTDFVIGFLYVNPTTGDTILKDVHTELSCIITKKEQEDLNSLLNHFILIKNYYIFIEYYQDISLNDFYYLMFQLDDVEIINCNPRYIPSVSKILKVKPELLEHNNNFKFKLLSKGTVSINSVSLSGKLECWLEILLLTDGERIAYLCLNSSYLPLIPLLEVDSMYTICCKHKLILCNNIELKRLNSTIPLYSLDENEAIFILNSNSSITLPTVKEVVSFLKNSKEMLSFVGVIKNKTFTDPLSSRTKIRNQIKSDGFNTPGLQTHCIEFQVENDSSDVLKVYLNNWENLMNPLGLIPNMRVAVHNVILQNKYFKSCALTRFEVLSYEPPVFFETCKLVNEYDWGQQSFLGYGNLIPPGIIIWTRLTSATLRSLTVKSRCMQCSTISQSLGKCVLCQNDIKVLETVTTLYVCDEFGRALIISHCNEILRIILDLEIGQWRIWCKAFECIGEYCYDREYSLSDMRDTNRIFCKSLTLLLKINNHLLSDLEVQCRKNEIFISDNGGLPSWYCINARKAIN